MVQTTEQVVLLSDDGEAIGTADKATVHTEDTPLHLAFSCHVFDDEGRMLVTRRALHKRTWPGVWTNSFCGHPAPGEDIVDAVHRRAADELGMTLEDVVPVLPDFRYLAVDASGIVENEVCPVYTARVSGSFDPHRDEVMEWRWVDPADLRVAVSAASWAFSPWLALQLDRLHPDPAQSVPAL